MFTAGNLANFLASLARGGLSFLLILWLQGIWLPLHGYSFEDTPLWAGIYMLPLTGGFLLMGPLSGWLSDRYGATFFSTRGMVLTAACFVGLLLLPANFIYWPFAVLLLLMGVGMGMFAAPNTTAIMNAVPPEDRGVASGMRATFMNAANTLSITLIFTLVILGLAQSLPNTLLTGLTAVGVPASAAQLVANLPPTGALFAAFLGYNPMSTLLPPAVLQALPGTTQAVILGKEFFPQLIAAPFQQGLRVAFLISTVLSLFAALASLLRGKRVIYGQEEAGAHVAVGPMVE
jgi:MFS family permease